MKNSPMPSVETLDCIKTLRNANQELVKLLNLVIAIIIGKGEYKKFYFEKNPIPRPISTILPIMLQAVGASSNTIFVLSEEPGLKTRDCYSVIRSIVELAINICYIIAEGPSAAENAISHSRQKSYKDLHRELKIGENLITLQYSSIPEISEIENLESDLQKFTSTTGREKRWTNLSVDERIGVVSKKLGNPEAMDLAWARFMVYRHSSEILHGTYFGTMYFWGKTQPFLSSYSPEKTIENIGEQLILILIADISSISAIMESLHKAYGFSCIIDKLSEINKHVTTSQYFKH